MKQPPFQAPRGTSDVLPEEQQLWDLFRHKVQHTTSKFGYGRVDTPLFEDARLFVRGVGKLTDIVEKETYTFEDRGGDLLTLRPEGTAPVCRAYLEHGMHNLPQPVRLHYIGPLFRYERPQAGRFRQHHQFGIEAIGDGDPSVDVEVIEVAWRLLENLGVSKLSLLINSIGDLKCRPTYINELQNYYRPNINRICTDCVRRLDSNPLRLLDCKEKSCESVISEAPGSVERLCEECSAHWNSLLSNLNAIGIPYRTDKRLVRGFDYYNRTVFEIIPPLDGRQNTIVGGGRYDGLIEELGGPPTPGVGFGMGIERVLVNLRDQVLPNLQNPKASILVAYLGTSAKESGLMLSSTLRQKGIPTVLAPSGKSLKSQLRHASHIKSTHVIIIGDRELSTGTVILRNLDKSEQQEIRREDLPMILEKT